MELYSIVFSDRLIPDNIIHNEENVKAIRISNFFERKKKNCLWKYVMLERGLGLQSPSQPHRLTQWRGQENLVGCDLC